MSLDDVDAFSKEQKMLNAKAKSKTVFSKQDWDEYVIRHPTFGRMTRGWCGRGTLVCNTDDI